MKEFIEGKHYYLDGGKVVFTEQYHLDRGTCCGSGCRHCPYDEETRQEMMNKRKVVTTTYDKVQEIKKEMGQ